MRRKTMMDIFVIFGVIAWLSMGLLGTHLERQWLEYGWSYEWETWGTIIVYSFVLAGPVNLACGLFLHYEYLQMKKRGSRF